MIIEPRMRGFICLTAHPTGCAHNVKKQIDYVKSKGVINGAKRVLVIGASTGFGLASRITSAFGSGASTIGVFLEKPPQEGKTATPGWYNSAAFEQEAHQAGLYAKSINGDAFSDEVKKKTIDLIKQDLGTVDLVVYSLASPVRQHPVTGVAYRSVLRPIGERFQNKTVDFHTGVVSEVSIDPANQEDIDDTIMVMGGEDWQMWMQQLKDADVLAPGVLTLAYSYIGPEITEPIYRKGTIGMAKNHLESTAKTLDTLLSDLGGKSYISVNKALVTQASSAIPVIPLYISILYKLMKEDGIHEGCIEQIHRLFTERLYTGGEVPTDEEGRIRIDDWEMKPHIQQKLADLWANATSDNLAQIGDLAGYKQDFMNLFGFGFEGVDYSADVSEMVMIPSINTQS